MKRTLLASAMLLALELVPQSASADVVLNSGDVSNISGQTIMSSTDMVPAINNVDGTLTGSNVTISTIGVDNNGAVASGNSGTVTLSDFDIATSGMDALGVQALSGSTITLSNGNVTTNGKGTAFGVEAIGSGSRLTMNGGSVTTHGNNAFGLSSRVDGVLNLHNTNVTTTGRGASGAAADLGGRMILNGGAISTSGQAANGLSAVTNGGDPATIISSSNISTSGVSAAGAFAEGSTITQTGGSILTTGRQSEGVKLQSGSTINLNDTRVSATGANSRGITSNKGVNTLMVSNTTISSASDSIFADAGTLNISFDNGSVVTNSNGQLLNVNSSGIVNISAANGSTLTGSAVTDALSTSSFNLASDAVWNLTGPSNLTTLVFDAGILRYGAQTRLDVANPIQLAQGGGTIDSNGFDHTLSARVEGTGGLRKLGQGTLTLAADNTYSGATTIEADTLAAGGANVFSPNSNYTVQAAGSLDLRGHGQTLASLNNAGTVNMGTGTTPGTVLTVNGNYRGDNGLLILNTTLAADNSATDKLIVTGDTTGTTRVTVNNFGGYGEQTAKGIEVVQVGGQSNGGFTLQGRAVAGAYEYLLNKGQGSDGNWYLQSQLSTPTPTPKNEPLMRPEAGAYTANITAANTMFINRLYDRLGETNYVDTLSGEKKVTSMWLRNLGGHTRFRDSSGQLKTQSNRYVMQLGGDIAQWSRTGSDRTHLGVMAGYGNSQSNSRSSTTNYAANGSVNGYNVGIYTTWLANETDNSGAYVDSWLQYGWFNNDVKGDELEEESYKSQGFTASLETGYTFKTGEFIGSNGSLNQWFIQPQAQAIWMGVKAKDHVEVNGTRIASEGDGNLMTRLGVRTYLKGHNKIDDGKEREFQPYIEINWLHNTNNFGTTMNNVTSAMDGAKNIAEVKVGLEGQISRQLNIWGNIGTQVGDKGYSDSAAMIGVKYNF
ncbi:autotransporter outer membrane beta-barrel domain-containing protein [Yersinia bercovieri]|uniref:autotransporter outer membrane beta-barrel domain-containing protein n=3 Tax=Yersinia bercovieri TaxID=634 RepID=UPI001643EA0E|nr:autotransporter outer membrane beta-barrel domain-containing protein [Yersinia bercovieri]